MESGLLSEPRPNMRVQRTRSSASPPHSPLGRQPLVDGRIFSGVGTERRHRGKSMLGVLVLLILAASGMAQDSMRQVVQPYLSAEFPCQSNVPPCNLPLTPAGAPLQLVVFATPGSFTGTVSFTSSDPRATLPSPYTFTTTDQGLARFTVILRSFGLQVVTVSDSLGTYASGTASITVVRQRRVRVV